MFISETLPNNLLFAVIGLVVSFISSFVAVLVLWKEPISDKNSETVESTELVFNAPVEGVVLPLSQVNDDVFSNKMLGEGVAIIPTKGELYAPIDGTIKMVYNTKHALGMQTSDGTEILFHIGLDTVNLDGKYFESYVKEGQTVRKGDLMIRFDHEAIKKAGFDLTTMIIITAPKNVTLKISSNKQVNIEEELFIIEGVGENVIA
jgi:PTS system beta-glucosides-specific IIC component